MNSTIELHGAQTGNSVRAAIALEEAGLTYTPRLVDLSSGAHQGADHLALNPLGKVPVLVEKQEAERRSSLRNRTRSFCMPLERPLVDCCLTMIVTRRSSLNAFSSLSLTLSPSATRHSLFVPPLPRKRKRSLQIECSPRS